MWLRVHGTLSGRGIDGVLRCGCPKGRLEQLRRPTGKGLFGHDILFEGRHELGDCLGHERHDVWSLVFLQESKKEFGRW